MSTTKRTTICSEAAPPMFFTRAMGEAYGLSTSGYRILRYGGFPLGFRPSRDTGFFAGHEKVLTFGLPSGVQVELLSTVAQQFLNNPSPWLYSKRNY